MKNNTIKKYLGPKETEVIARLSYEKVSLVTKEQLDRWFGFSPELRKQIVFRLKNKGVLLPIKRGLYFFSPLESGPKGSRINEFLIPPVLFPNGNYYIGYSTMYSYYGFTDQIFQTMYILNTSIQREKVIGSIQFKMVKISSTRMYGLKKIKIKNADVIVSDRERTLVDLIYFPQPVGGLKKAFYILKEEVKYKKIDIKKLVKYAVRFPSVSVRKRIGFVLDSSGVNENILKPLLKSVKDTSLVALFPSSSRKGRINRKWMVIENAP